MEEKKQHISEWLEKLQQESWNLELLVSGFSIFLLMQTYDLFNTGIQYVNLHMDLNANIEGPVRTFLLTFLLISTVLTINLIVHVIIRGFWIGAVGLRSVQQTIDFEKFGYSDFFTKKLKEKVPSLDKMLERLDTLASVIFSFTFLVAFMFLSFLLFFIAVCLFSYVGIFIFQDWIENETIREGIILVMQIIILTAFLGAVIYFIDTLSLGFFKKYKRLSRIYYPIYTFMGWLTMAGIYRTIYYSLISRFSKNKIRLVLGSYLILIFLFPFQKFDQYLFYPDNSDEYEISSRAYDDTRSAEHFIATASIPTKVIKDSFLPLFIRYNVEHNRVLRKMHKDLEFAKNDGWISGIYFNKKNGLRMGDPNFPEENPEKFLTYLTDFYTVYLDSVKVEGDMYFYTHPNQNEKGLHTLLDLAKLSRGKHEILIKRKKTNKDQIEDMDYTRIPFWKE